MRSACFVRHRRVRWGVARSVHLVREVPCVLFQIRQRSRRDESNRSEVASDVGITGSAHVGRSTMTG